MADILIVEDNVEINALISACLEERHVCHQVYSGTEADLFLQSWDVDLMILDLMLPGLSGEDLLRKWRHEKSFPVLIISAKDALHNKLDCFRLGVDDYLTKPFDIEELEARVEVLLRRHREMGERPPETGLGDSGISLDSERRDLLFQGVRLHLTGQEFRIIAALIREPEKVFSREELYLAAWDEEYIGDDRALNVHISNLRKKLRDAGAPPLVETVWGLGFCLFKV